MSDEPRRLHGHQFGKTLCEALGLDASHVRSLTLYCSVDHPVTVSAEVFVFSDDGGNIAKHLKKYNLIEAEPYS